MVSNVNTLNSIHHEFSCDLGFELIYIFFPEQELPVQISDIYSIHINHRDAFYATES